MIGTHHLLILPVHCTARCLLQFLSIKSCGADFFSFSLNFYIDRTYFTVYYGRSFLLCYDILVYKNGMSIGRLVLHGVKRISYNHDLLTPQGVLEDASTKLSV
jgi:hypothetical protein